MRNGPGGYDVTRVTITRPAGASCELLRVEGALFEQAGGGFDIDVLEANSAVLVEVLTGTITGGSVDVPVTLTDSDPGGINHFLAVIRDGDGHTGAASAKAVVQYDPDLLHRVNVAGAATADPNGDWLADGGNGAGFLTGGGGNTFSSSSGNGVPVTASDGSDPVGTPLSIYDDERWDPPAAPEMTWTFPVAASGTYEVRLYIAEIYNGVTAAGARVFDVQGEAAIPAEFVGLDPFGITGAGGIGTMASATVTDDGDGNLVLEFLHTGFDNPAIKAIEVRNG